ncbi:MAG: HipA domain-containing protein [Oscillospiraceae bacterium]|nr:HipA domain-containing protein [Oscillospiraceae bacterium]
MIDFSACRVIPGRAYNGANGSKIAVEYEGAAYMLKFPPSGKGKPTELSYTNSCISEHIASSIFNLLGIRAQETMLGTYAVKGKEKLVCACKDFTAGGKRLLDFCAIKNTVLDSDSNGSGTELADVLDAMDKQQLVSPTALREHFWNMFVADALLGNFDRHNGNWGFLYDDARQEAEIAPVFDCGSCLLPQADDKVMRKVLDKEEELHARVFQFPTSALKRNGRKLNYYDFLISAQQEEANQALARIVPRIGMAQIKDFIDRVQGITDLQKEFYQTYLQARYDRILRPALERSGGRRT